MDGLWKKLLGLLMEPEEAFTDDERQYQREWLFKNALAVNRRIVFISIWLTGGAVVLGLLALEGEFRSIFCWSHGVATGIIILAWIFSRQIFFPKILHVILQVTLVGAVAYGALRTTVTAPEQSVAAFGTLLALTLGFLRLSPLSDLEYIVGSAAGSWLISLIVFPWSGVGIQFICIQFIGLSVALGHERVRFKHIRREAALELRTRRLQAMAERARATHEMALAKEIQESFSPPNERTVSGPLSASWHQRQCEPLGGDWAAIKALGRDRLVVVVADVTGKGVQAALVVHAVQSLWASGCVDSGFDPGAWIAQLNATLFHLGRRQKQTLTLGLADILPGRVTYWSAGHLPLFLVHEPYLDYDEAERRGEVGAVQALTARGGIVGLDAELALRPVTATFGGEAVQLLLATDGVFPGGTRSARAQILKLAREFARDGDGVLDRPGYDDDRTLVVVRRAA